MKDSARILIVISVLLLGVVVPVLLLRPGSPPVHAPVTAPEEELREPLPAAQPAEIPRETPSAAALGRQPSEPQATEPPVGPMAATPFRALSLRRLEARLVDCGQRRSDCPESAFHLDDLTILDGYVTDPRDHDVILVGRSDPDRPPLPVEDFAVALRGAWGKYDERRGNTIYTSDPGCSIDPDPAVVNELEDLAGRIFATSGDGGLEAWNRICRKPQAVGVMGVPFHSHFAEVMVEADYDMKSQVDGSDPLEIPGLVSLTDMTLNQIRRQVESGQTQGLALSSMNRFWFNPGESLFEESDDTVLIRRSPVILLTHQTFVNAGGQIADAAARDPLAELFAANFTRLFDQVAERRPIFRELEGLFRFVAVARILEVKLKTSPFAGALAYLLDSLPIETTRVDKHKPGQANVKGFEHRQEVPGGVQILSLRLPSCGGVAMPIDVSPNRFRHSSAAMLKSLQATVLRAKDATQDVSWTLPDTADGAVDDLHHSLRASELSGSETESPVFFVRDNLQGDRPTHYALYSGLEDPLYKGSDFDELLEALVAHSRSRPIILHRDLSSPSRDAGFDHSLALRQAMRRDLPTILIEEAGDLAVRPGTTTVERVGTIQRVTQGALKGLYAATLYVTHTVGNVIKRFAITIYGHTPEAVKNAIEALKRRLAETFPDIPWPLSFRVGAGIRELDKAPAGVHVRELEKPQADIEPSRSVRLT